MYPFYWSFWLFLGFGFRDYGGILEACNWRVCLCVCLRSVLQGCVSKTKEKKTVLMEFLEQQEVLSQKQGTSPDFEGP